MGSSSLVAGAIFVLLVVTTIQVDAKWYIANCASYRTMGNFSQLLYMGTWYEQWRYAGYFEFRPSCGKAEYGKRNQSNVNSFSVDESEVSQPWGSNDYRQGVATRTGPVGEGEYSVSFANAGRYTRPYFILDTDYTSYSFVWSCKHDYGMFSNYYLKIYTRDKNPGENRANELKDRAYNRGMVVWKLKRSTQNCNN